MALPKRKARNITVDNVVYQYIISVTAYDLLLDEYAPIHVTIQNKQVNGNKLFVKGLITRSFWLDFPNPKKKSEYPTISTKDIRKYIQKAQKEGYNPFSKGKDFTLEVDS